MTIWVGTSGWSYRHWRGVFYPEGVAQRRWLEYYAERFNTVELNTTFYRLPPASIFAAWASRVSPDFRFSVKVSRCLSHTKRLREPMEGWARLDDAGRALGGHLGTYLVQLPPGLEPDAARLGAFLDAAPAVTPVAVEARDAAWFTHEIYATLETHRAVLVWTDFDGMECPEWVTGPILYVRRHGTAGRYAGRYTDDRLRELAAKLQAFPGDAYCYFNNDAGGAAALDAAALRDLVNDRSPA